MAKYLVCMNFGLSKLKGMENELLYFEANGENPTDAYQNAFDNFLNWKKEAGCLIEGIKSNDYEGAETAFIHPFKFGKKKYKKCLGLVFSQEKLDNMKFADSETQNAWIADVAVKLEKEAKDMNV